MIFSKSEIVSLNWGVMKKFFSGMIIVAAITAGSAWWFQKFYIDQPDNPSSPFFKIDDIVGDQSNNELEINSEQILTKEVDAPVGRKHAKRLVFIPHNNPDRSQSDREIDVEFQHSVNQMVESSLTGKKEGAIALSQLFNQCGVEFEHEAQIRSRLQMTDQTGFNPQAHYSLGNGEMRKFESVYDVAGDPELGISGVLESIETAIKKYVPVNGVLRHI